MLVLYPWPADTKVRTFYMFTSCYFAIYSLRLAWYPHKGEHCRWVWKLPRITIMIVIGYEFLWPVAVVVGPCMKILIWFPLSPSPINLVMVGSWEDALHSTPKFTSSRKWGRWTWYESCCVLWLPAAELVWNGIASLWSFTEFMNDDPYSKMVIVVCGWQVTAFNL